MIDNSIFPFGQPVRRVAQQDRRPKKVASQRSTSREPE
jgi:hypothetical protein